jgi:hypothetical protein
VRRRVRAVKAQLSALAIVVGLGLSAVAAAGSPPAVPARSVAALPERTDLRDLVRWARGFTGSNIVIDSQVSGRRELVTVHVADQLTERQAWQIFLVTLSMLDLEVIPQGGTLLVVPVKP